MKKLYLLALIILPLLIKAQTITYLKVADKEEYQKYLSYCLEGVSRTFYMKGEVTVLSVNGYYAQPVTGEWTAKYPLVIKWWPINTKTTTTEAYQHQIVVPVEVMVPRRYPTSIDDFYKNWKTGKIQSGLYMDSKSIAIWPLQ